ncbi:MAG: VWA domain-containing protein [Candidatus Kapabacteria bacterium]|nr:VWA domain-containing protein [Candidatus Kapabacteria bacterium]
MTIRQLMLCSCLAVTAVGCRQSHTVGQIFDLRSEGERTKEVRFTQTRSIDSVDITNLDADVWKVEHYKYPDSIKLFVRVLDSTGYVVTNMAQPYKRPDAPDYFTALKETLGTSRRFKKTANITDFTVREYGEGDSIPTYISLAIDYSGSMKGAVEMVAYGTEIFLELGRPCDNIAMTAFHKDITKVFPLTNDTEQMLREYRAYHKRGVGLFTVANDGIMAALRELDTVPIDRPKICVVFADGDENSSRTKIGDIFEYAVKHNVSIYCVGFGYANDEALQNLSVYTGGKYYRAYSKAELLAIMLDIHRSLRNFYLVSYKPPKYDGLHTADVTVSVPGRDTMIARGIYDKTPLNPMDVTDEFSKPILFAYNSAEIDSTTFFHLDELADNLQRFERVVLEVQGHTDSVGGEEYNKRLSLARAESVKTALILRGIDESRLRVRGLGMSMPVATNETAEGRARNRRTVFRILRK